MLSFLFIDIINGSQCHDKKKITQNCRQFRIDWSYFELSEKLFSWISVSIQIFQGKNIKLFGMYSFRLLPPVERTTFCSLCFLFFFALCECVCVCNSFFFCRLLIVFVIKLKHLKSLSYVGRCVHWMFTLMLQCYVLFFRSFFFFFNFLWILLIVLCIVY